MLIKTNNKNQILTTSKIGWCTILFLLMLGCKPALDNNNKYNDSSNYITFVYTSDAHYGITRPRFRGETDVDAQIVNQAMMKQINSVSNLVLPNDEGVNAGNKVGGVDFLIETGDIANRQETQEGIQSASISWNEFMHDYSTGLTLKDDKGVKTKLYLLPGNHDVSNAIGFTKPLTPLIDASSMVGIYNLYMHPSIPKTNETYNYKTDKINYSFDCQGIHFGFITMWPDSAQRIWLNKDLANVSSPVLLFTHDEPDIEAKHFTNPNPSGTINTIDKFQNLVEEKCKDGYTTKASSNIEQRSLALWLKDRPNIKAYFHGNSNSNEYYTYRGPDNNISLATFRVDSPMKGVVSRADETKLSFQLVTIDVVAKKMTVRECLWNTNPSQPNTPVVFGESKTISLYL